LFEVVLVKQPANPADLIDILAGLAKRTYDGENLQLLHSSCVKFRFEEDVAWTIDGEDGGLHRDAEITNCRKAVNLIV
jgi:diacylglycerol kinase family enzyme